MNKRKFLVILSLLCCAKETISQSQTVKPKLETFFSFGLSVQAFTLDGLANSGRKNQRIQSSILGGGGNAIGLGLPLNFKLYSWQRNVGISYEPVIRYDVVEPIYFGSVDDKDKYGVFADHHFTIYRKFRFTKKDRERTKYMGAGYSLISPGISFDYEWETVNFTTGKVTRGSKVDLSFDGFHILYGMKVYKRFYTELKLMYIPAYRIIYNQDQASIWFLLKASYQIQLNKKK